MALNTAPTPIGRPRAVPGVRSDSARIVLPVNDALAPCVEGQALCMEVDAGVRRLTTAAMAGSRLAVISEAQRLGFRAARYRAEFARMAREIEGPEDDAA